MRKVLVIGTGGTISCVRGENGLAPQLSVSELMKEISLPAKIEVCTEQLFCLDSTNMTPRHWEQLARYIRERYDEFDGFVITHGTDTMAYAAAAVSVLIQNSKKPVVFTGSVKPMKAKDSDAPVNMRDAVCFAAKKRAFGVCVVFCGMIFHGSDAHKWDTESLKAFNSMNRGTSGRIDAKGKLINFCEKHSGETRFYERLSDEVFLSKLIPGQRLCVPENARAIILESYGAGGVPDYLFDDAAALADRGVYLIIATQCEYGGTKLSEYEVGRSAAKRLPLIEAGRLTAEYAVARAQWALAYSDSYEGFKELFYTTYSEVNKP
ncbi:MAG: asparaginase [Oscillospiraceae bacterium]|nr:asparaginase [Oscillospiraceae bacterium]